MKYFPGPWFRVATSIFQNPLALVGGFLLCFASIAARGQSVSFAGAQSVLPTSGVDALVGIAVDSYGNVYTTSGYYFGQLLEFSRTAAGYAPQVVLPVSGLFGPWGIAVDSAGDLFLSAPDYGNGSAAELPWTPAGFGPLLTLPTKGLAYDLGLAVNSAGDVFITDYANDRVVEVPRTATGYGRQTVLPFMGLPQAFGVAVDSAGDVFIADTYHNRVVELPWTGTAFGPQSVLPFSGLTNPTGVAVDNAGNVFIADLYGVIELPKTATGYGPQATLPGSNYGDPYAVAVDSAGNLFVADFYGRAVALQTLSVDFGGANVCEPGATTPTPCSQTLTLTYNVNADTTLGEPQVATGGLKYLDFNRASGSTCIGAVTAGTTCTVNVTFAPLAAGFRHGSVGLPGGGHDITITQLSGFGIEATTGAPVAQLSTSKLSFGAIHFGITKTFPLFVANIGGGTLTVAPSISGPSYKIAESTCAAGVTPGNSCTLVVKYSPVSIGPHDDTLTVATNGGSSTVGLFGSVVGLSVLGGVSGATLEFGTVSSGSTEVELLTVTNVGLPGTVMVETAISGLSFSVLTTGQNTCLAGITAGQSCTLPIEFAPTKSGLHDELLTLAPSPGGGNTTVWLTGSTP